MMLIVKESLIQDSPELALYQGAPFTGVALTIENGVVIARVSYKDGKRLGEYSSTYFIRESEIHIDANSLDHQEDNPYLEPYSYQGKLFDGIAYRFDNDICWLEMQCESGWPTSETEYDSFGRLLGVKVADGEVFFQQFRWVDGKLSQMRISERDQFNIGMGLDEGGRLRALSLDGDYFRRVEQIRDRFRFHMFERPDSFAKMFCSASLYLAGSSVTDDLFAQLVEGDGLRETSRIQIHGAPLSAVSLGRLVGCASIKQLEVQTTTLSLEDVRRFKSLRTDCRVKLNQRIIEA